MIFKDIRLKAAACDILSPSPKEDMNPRSFAYLKLLLLNKNKSVLFATLPKSGWNWTADILTYYIVKHFTGAYHLELKEADTIQSAQQKPVRLFAPADSRATRNSKIKDIFPDLKIDYCFHTHKSWKEPPIWGLDEAKTILITRNIPTTLYSFYKNRSFLFKNVQECIDAGFLNRAIKFYNSWGKFCETHKNYKVFRYENYKQNPLEQFSSLIEYIFNTEVNNTLLKEAIDFYSFGKQKEREEKYAKDKSKQFYFEGGVEYSHLFPKETLDYIYEKLNKDLKFKFGYTYNDYH